MFRARLKKAGVIGAVLAAAWLFLRYLLPLALPFLLGLLLAFIAEPLVSVLCRRLRLPRWLGAGLGVTVALMVTVLLVLTLCAFLLRQLGQLARVMPDLEGTARQSLQTLESLLLQTAEAAPQSIRPLLIRGVEGMFSDSGAVLDGISGGVLRFASGVLTRIPDSALGVGTWLIASFMISARLPMLRAQVKQKLPKDWRERYLPMAQRLKKTAGLWLLAQGKLTAITFGVLCAGFLLLRISYGPLWAALIALLDALPVLGTGIVLIPWSVVAFAQGEIVLGVGLLGTYAAAAVLRSVLEPKLVGKQLGLDPLVTLGAMYAGYRLWGIGGMILFPLLAAMTALLVRKQ